MRRNAGRVTSHFINGYAEQWPRTSVPLLRILSRVLQQSTAIDIGVETCALMQSRMQRTAVDRARQPALTLTDGNINKLYTCATQNKFATVQSDKARYNMRENAYKKNIFALSLTFSRNYICRLYTQCA